MPHSHPFGKEWAQPYYKIAKPQYVVDFACGAGMWYDALANQTDRKHVHWVGVDIWEPYISKYGLMTKYNSVILQDIREFVSRDFVVPNTFYRSLGIAGDVLEHMLPEEAETFVSNAKKHFTDLLISTPIIHYEQGALEGNPYEEHVWHPTHDDIMNMIEPVAHAVGDIVGVYWWTK